LCFRCETTPLPGKGRKAEGGISSGTEKANAEPICSFSEQWEPRETVLDCSKGKSVFQKWCRPVTWELSVQGGTGPIGRPERENSAPSPDPKQCGGGGGRKEGRDNN